MPLPCSCSSPPAWPSARRWPPPGHRTGRSCWPSSVGECGRCDVLGRLIQGHADRVGPVLVGCSPGAEEELVGPPAEQERVGALVGLVDQRLGLVVARPLGPSAALESVPAVSSDAPPFPCTTPSMVIGVMAVSFMIAVPPPAAPLWGGLSPLLRTPRPRPTPPPDFFRFLVRPWGLDEGRPAPREAILPSSCVAPAVKLRGRGRQIDRCLSQSSAACATSRQPWSIVSEWPRSWNSMRSVMAGDLWYCLRVDVERPRHSVSSPPAVISRPASCSRYSPSLATAG